MNNIRFNEENLQLTEPRESGEINLNLEQGFQRSKQ